MKRTFKLIAGLIAVLAVAVGCQATTANTGPPTNQQPCTSNTSGLLTISSPNTTVDRRCHSGTVLFTSGSDGSTLSNSVVTADPDATPESFTEGVYIEDGAENIVITYNEIDCNGNGGGSNGIYQGGLGSTIHASYNEIRNCENGVTIGANAQIDHNLIHQPDTNEENHSDGFQIFEGAHDLTIEWNNVDYPLASSAFQFHTSPGDQNYNITLRYNKLLGGAAVLRVPGDNSQCYPPNDSCGPWDGTLKIYGNRLDLKGEGSTYYCSGNPTSIGVWGSEEPPHLDWNNSGTIGPEDAFGEMNRVDDGGVELVWPNRNTDEVSACEPVS